MSARHRLTVNSLITEPGTFEWEWYGAVAGAGGFTIPTVWKVTPATGESYWSHTELSAAFNALTATETDGRNILQASDHLSFAATTALGAIGPMQLAVAPSLTFLLRGDTGIRAGVGLFGKVDGKRQQAGCSLTWSGASRPSDTNPSGTLDAGAGYGINLSRGGVLAKLTAHTNAVWERSSGLPSLFTLSEGMEYQATPRFSTDLTFQQVNLRSGTADNQVVASITWNLGPIRNRNARRPDRRLN